MPKRNCPSDKASLARKEIEDWVANKVSRLKDSVRLSKKTPEKLALEFADGSIFTKEDPLNLPSWEATLGQIQKFRELTPISRDRGAVMPQPVLDHRQRHPLASTNRGKGSPQRMGAKLMRAAADLHAIK